jgi:predicted negative regulator of RcsB-dependent stress response
MSALAAAKSAFDANDLKTAKAQLQWVIDNGNDEYKSVAQLRLAGVLLDEKAYDQAPEAAERRLPAAVRAEVADRKGDVLVAQNKIAEARRLQAALAAMDKKHPGASWCSIKLDAIGGTPAASRPKAAA